ncbi:uncharacterized protein EAF02_002715 [Botrytis sinoallii]|uniref:uncharacterized protein n=1 Tax=Botrytis sinoallii TaxID=1463999 RepID=UPI0019013B1B|nr:uncharacterized protein EAF02_002715 [Botrytis sinoallii]KAF7888174.1 hypothetical protein EAF02_002715 [Botrytis sinoallii]
MLATGSRSPKGRPIGNNVMGGGFDQFTLRFRLGGRNSSIDNIASGQSKDFKGRERREGREGKEWNGAYAKEVAGCNVKL